MGAHKVCVALSKLIAALFSVKFLSVGVLLKLIFNFSFLSRPVCEAPEHGVEVMGVKVHE